MYLSGSGFWKILAKKQNFDFKYFFQSNGGQNNENRTQHAKICRFSYPNRNLLVKKTILVKHA